MDHVRTQLPYALLVAVAGMLVGDIPTAFGMPWPISYALGIIILFAVLRVVGTRADLGIAAEAPTGESAVATGSAD